MNNKIMFFMLVPMIMGSSVPCCAKSRMDNRVESKQEKVLSALIQDTTQYLEKFDLAQIPAPIIERVLQGDKQAPRLVAESLDDMGSNIFVYLADGKRVDLVTATGKLRQLDTDILLTLAAQWYNIAAKRGDGLAMRGLADLADNALSRAEWLKRSFEILTSSASTSRELLFLTRCYGRGEGTSIDHSRAVETYLRYIERCKVEKKTGYVPPSNCMTPVPDELKQYASGEFTQDQLKSR